MARLYHQHNSLDIDWPNKFRPDSDSTMNMISLLQLTSQIWQIASHADSMIV